MICTTALVAMFPHFTDGWRPTSVGSVDHDTLPVRCHFADPADASRCALVLESFALSWEVQVDTLGFAEPLLDDDDRFDVYITEEFTEGGAYVAGEGGDVDPDDGRMAQPSYMALDATIPDDEMPGYVAHEFNHVLQYSTDFVEPTLPVWEATATAAEAWTIPGYKILGEWVADFQAHGWMGLLGDGYMLWDDYGIWSYHEYGAGIWILHLDHTSFEGTGTGGAALWWALAQDSRENEPDVFDAWGAVTGGTWADALVDFVAFNLVSHDPERRPAWVDDRDDGDWGSVPTATVSESELPMTVVPEHGVAPSGWVHLELPDAPEHLVVSVEGDDAADLVLVAVAEDGSVQTTDTWPARLELTGAVELAVVHTANGEFDADDRLVMSPLEITLAVVPPADPDDPAGADTADDLADGEAGAGAGGTDDSDKGGCSVAGSATGGGLLLALAVVARRRGGTARAEG